MLVIYVARFHSDLSITQSALSSAHHITLEVVRKDSCRNNTKKESLEKREDAQKKEKLSQRK